MHGWSDTVLVRRPVAAGTLRLWALTSLPNIGYTADPSLPLDAPNPPSEPGAFPDLTDVQATFVARGGEFLVVQHGGYVVSMGGYKLTGSDSVEILRVRVHPASRRRGLGSALTAALEESARTAGFKRAHLDTCGLPKSPHKPPTRGFASRRTAAASATASDRPDFAIVGSRLPG
ncbi:MAG: GNAT family N-acetyltransferase [Mycobacteriales bacterium]